MNNADIDLGNVGLLPQHKERLEKYADRYCDASTRAARREVALLAADDVVKEFKITGKEEIALTNQVCGFTIQFILCHYTLSSRTMQRVINWFYDRFVRNINHIKPEKFGFLKKVTGSQLWAASHWDWLKGQVEEFLRLPENNEAVWIGAYQTVRKREWDRLAGTEIVAKWEEEARNINSGNISREQQAL